MSERAYSQFGVNVPQNRKEQTSLLSSSSFFTYNSFKVAIIRYRDKLLLLFVVHLLDLIVDNITRQVHLYAINVLPYKCKEFLYYINNINWFLLYYYFYYILQQFITTMNVSLLRPLRTNEILNTEVLDDVVVVKNKT